MINDDEELPIVAYAVLVGTMFVTNISIEENMVDGKKIIGLQLGYLDDGCKIFMTADDAQKVADLCNGVVERVKFIDE